MQTRTSWPAVSAALAAGIISAGYIGKMPTALPTLTSELDLSLIASSWLVSMFNFIALACAIFFGLLTDRVGALRFCIAGLACLMLGGFGGAFAHSTAQLLASRVVEGAGFVAVIVSAPSLIAAATAPQERGLSLGLWSTYMPAGSSITLALSPLALATFGWRGLWLAIVVATLACVAWITSQSRHYATVTSGTARPLSSVKTALAQPIPWWLGAAFAVYTLQFSAVMIWMPTYMKDERGIGTAAGALLTALFVAVNVIGAIYGSRLVHRNASRGRMIIGTFIGLAICAVGIFSTGLPDLARYAAAVAFSIVAGLIPAAVLSAGSRYAHSPAEVGTILGLIVQISNVGQFLGPPLAATMVTMTGRWEGVLIVLLASTVLGLICGSVILRHERTARS